MRTDGPFIMMIDHEVIPRTESKAVTRGEVFGIRIARDSHEDRQTNCDLALAVYIYI